MYCVYVQLVKKNHCIKYCKCIRRTQGYVIQHCCSTASDSAPLQFLAPHRMCNGEYFVIKVKQL